MLYRLEMDLQHTLEHRREGRNYVYTEKSNSPTLSKEEELQANLASPPAEKVHYTISKDMVGESTKNKLAAIAGKQRRQKESPIAKPRERFLQLPTKPTERTASSNDETDGPRTVVESSSGESGHSEEKKERAPRAKPSMPAHLMTTPTPQSPSQLKLPVPAGDRMLTMLSNGHFGTLQGRGGTSPQLSPSLSITTPQGDAAQGYDENAHTRGYDHIVSGQQASDGLENRREAIRLVKDGDEQLLVKAESDRSGMYEDWLVDAEDELTQDEGERKQSKKQTPSGKGRLNTPVIPTNILAEMKQRILELEARNSKLSGRDPKKVSVQVFHCLKESSKSSKSREQQLPSWYGTAYLAEPTWEVHGDYTILTSQLPVADPKEYEGDNHVTFSIYQVYEPESQHQAVLKAAKTRSPLPSPTPVSQYIKLVSGEMRQAFQLLYAQFPDVSNELKDAAQGHILKSPFIWWYHYRSFFDQKKLRRRHRELILTLTKWLDSSYGQVYDAVGSQFLQGKVSAISLQFLFRAGDVVISKQNGSLQGHICCGEPKRQPFSQGLKGEDQPTIKHSYNLKTREFSYAGELFWKEQSVVLSFETKTEDEEIWISSLSYIPIDFVSPEDLAMLRYRGAMFWKCRQKRYVSYEGDMKNRKHAVSPNRLVLFLAQSFRGVFGLIYTGLGSKIHGRFQHLRRASS